MNVDQSTVLRESAARASQPRVKALEVKGVSKRYAIYDRPEDRLKQAIIPRLQVVVPRHFRRKSPYFKEFWALRDIWLDLEPGDALGILGRNGAGKSTLLQIIAGTLTPTSGTTISRGKVAALLELGSGFSPEFTGRENVRLSASLLGLTSEEIDQRFGEIVAFADIGDFIDQPVKTYSSGMMLRLAFAVQTAVEPEILIVDEALAVGDARFQRKCFARLEQLRKAGTTILLVTHDSGTIVQFCTHAMILEDGRVFASGEPQRIAREYHKLLFDTSANTSTEKTGSAKAAADKPAIILQNIAAREGVPGVDAGEIATRHREVRYGTGEAQIAIIGLRDASGAETTVIETHDTCEAYFKAFFPAPIASPVAYGFIISNARGVEVYGTKSGLFSTSIRTTEAECFFECRLRFVARLIPGRYFLTAAVAHDDDRLQGQFLDFRFDAFEFQVIGPSRAFTTSLVDLDAQLSHVSLGPV